MRKSVLSVFIALFFVSSITSAFAVPADQLPGYVNERFYPDSVQKVQKTSDNSFISQLCGWLGGFGTFWCESVRTQEIIVPETVSKDNESLTEQDATGAQSQLENTLGASEYVDELNNVLDSAQTDEDVLGVADAVNALLEAIGGGEEESGHVNTKQPYGTHLCNESDSKKVCTEKMAVALLPASLQDKTVAQRPPAGQPTEPDNSDGTVNPVPTLPGGQQGPLPDPGTGQNPPPLSGQGIGYNLVTGFQSACSYAGVQGVVTQYNVSCLDNVVPTLNAGPKAEFRNSALSWGISINPPIPYNHLQCVGFVRGANHQLKNEILDNGGNAIDYATNIPTGYRLVRKASLVTSPKVGDLLLWNTGTWGHIAYISVVYDKDNVGVIEANWGTPGRVQYRNVNVRSYDILGWLTK